MVEGCTLKNDTQKFVGQTAPHFFCTCPQLFFIWMSDFIKSSSIFQQRRKEILNIGFQALVQNWEIFECSVLKHEPWNLAWKLLINEHSQSTLNIVIDQHFVDPLTIDIFHDFFFYNWGLCASMSSVPCRNGNLPDKECSGISSSFSFLDFSFFSSDPDISFNMTT